MTLKPGIHPADAPEIRKAFAQAVNTSLAEIARWLETAESGSVGFVRRGETESVGHGSGRRIVEILKTPADELSAGDHLRMGRTAGFIKRHRAHRPVGDIR